MNLREPPRVVGIGAMNMDYVYSGQIPTRRLAELGLRTGAEIVDDEISVGDDWLAGLLSEVMPENLTRRSGGSSLNAMRALAKLNSGVQVGFVGCMGDASSDPALHGVLVDCSIDTRYVWRASGHMHGSCLAIPLRGRRLLLTGRGANDILTPRLLAHEDDLAVYLSDSAAVHVSSLLDRAALAPLIRILGKAKRANANLLVSFDPGAIWSGWLEAEPAVWTLAELCDLIFLNRREARLWRASGFVAAFQGVIVEKLRGGARAYLKDGTNIRAQIHPLAEDEIRDPLGAGDVFAAGVLAVLSRRREALDVALDLGLILARRKLAFGEPNDVRGYAAQWAEIGAQVCSD
jgi:sugar/nucleoside kinase (ribokinase family)